MVGYDIAAYVTPKLTTVAQDLSGKAAEAMRLMMDRVAGKDRPEHATSLGVELIERARPLLRRSDDGDDSRLRVSTLRH